MENIDATILNWVQTLAIIIAGLWAYFRLVRERAFHPNIEFSIKCNFFGPEDGSYLAEYIVVFKNKGLTRQKVSKVSLRCRGIKKDTAFNYWEGRNKRVNFSEKLLDEPNLIPKGYNYLFVEPGVDQEYRYISKIPQDIGYILAHSEFSYDKTTPHSTEVVLKVDVV